MKRETELPFHLPPPLRSTFLFFFFSSKDNVTRFPVFCFHRGGANYFRNNGKEDGIEIMTTAKTLATIQVSVKTNFLSFAYLFCCISTSVLPLLIFSRFKSSDLGSVLGQPWSLGYLPLSPFRMAAAIQNPQRWPGKSRSHSRDLSWSTAWSHARKW